MRAAIREQEALLALFQQDLALGRLQREREQVALGSELVELKRALAVANTALAEITHALEQTDLELHRAEQDLALVDKRIALDRDRINQTSSSKDAQGIQSELESLAKRKLDLEDIELAVMERQEGEQARLTEATTKRDEISQRLEEETLAVQRKLAEIEAQLLELGRQRASAAAVIAQELVAEYERLRARGVPVGRLSGRDCQACQLSLSASDYARLIEVPADEVVHCPDCSAILIRG